MSSIAEVFPGYDEVSLFVVSMSMARNDIEHSARSAAQANADDAPEFGYLVRVATGHTFDALEALGEWRQKSEAVRRFLGKLPPKGAAALSTATGTLQRVGGGAVEHVRNRTFHYPQPGAS